MISRTVEPKLMRKIKEVRKYEKEYKLEIAVIMQQKTTIKQTFKL